MVEKQSISVEYFSIWKQPKHQIVEFIVSKSTLKYVCKIMNTVVGDTRILNMPKLLFFTFFPGKVLYIYVEYIFGYLRVW